MRASSAPGRPPERPKGLLAFYVFTGMALLLFVAFYFAWTPIRALHYERQLIKKCSSEHNMMKTVVHWNMHPDILERLPGWQEANRLVALGTPASAAVERLLRSDNEAVRGTVTAAVMSREARWTMPILLSIIRDNTGPGVSSGALMAARKLAGLNYFLLKPEEFEMSHSQVAKQWRKELLDWWESEGKANYGRGLE